LHKETGYKAHNQIIVAELSVIMDESCESRLYIAEEFAKYLKNSLIRIQKKKPISPPSKDENQVKIPLS
jgi:hypothetical protein